MTINQRAQARANNQRAAPFTELWIIGSPEEITSIVRMAVDSGLLAYASAPIPMGGDDPRTRQYLRLRRASRR